MTNFKAMMLTTAALTLLAAPVMAQSTSTTAQPNADAHSGTAHGSVESGASFQSLDTDRNGELSRNELNAATGSTSTTAFNSIDSNGDGVVTDAEYNAYTKKSGTADTKTRTR